MIEKNLWSPVAQLVEQVAVNHWVGGSSPSRGAIFHKMTKVHALCFFVVPAQAGIQKI